MSTLRAGRGFRARCTRLRARATRTSFLTRSFSQTVRGGSAISLASAASRSYAVPHSSLARGSSMNPLLKAGLLGSLLLTGVACSRHAPESGPESGTPAAVPQTPVANPPVPEALPAAPVNEPTSANHAAVLLSPVQRGQILAVAAQSACASHVFAGRGRAPVGYIKGVALTYAKSYCELKQGGQTAVTVMSQPVGTDGLDALAHYGRSDATALGRLRAVYALSIGEGMRESSGNTTEGRDENVPLQNATEANAEAGLFQVSFDSFAAVETVSPTAEHWLQVLYSDYQHPEAACELDVFMEHVSDREKPVVGSGDGARFQALTKACPAFATEYVEVMLRSDLPHFGPIKRKEAELFDGCEVMLHDVEAVADAACQ